MLIALRRSEEETRINSMAMQVVTECNTPSEKKLEHTKYKLRRSMSTKETRVQS